MKTKIIITLATLVLASISGRAATIGTEFTYQGRLTEAAGSPSGAYDFTFTLHLAASGGVPLVTVTNLNTAVSNGLFTTIVDFGGGIYNGNAYWISLGVRSNGAGGSFTALTPRQPLTPTPNASYASLAGAVPAGSITSANLAGDSVYNRALQDEAVTAAKVARGEVVKSLNGLRDDVALSAGSNVTITPSGNTLTIAGSSGWNLGGNAGTTVGADFLGTTDNQALELKVNGVRGFRLQPGTVSPNVVGGGFSSVAAGLNAVTIGGGQENTVSSSTSTIGGGFRNAIGGGGQDSTIGGGQINGISNNTAAATVAGGTLNSIGVGSPYAAIGGGRFNRIADGGVQATIGGGRNNLIGVNSADSTIAGGTNNLVGTNSAGATVGGGHFNEATGFLAPTVAGGEYNRSTEYGATVGGGVNNLSSGIFATVPGGLGNQALGYNSFAAGDQARALHDGCFVWSDVDELAPFAQSTADNQFVIRAAGGIQVWNNTSLHFGSQNRQMLNLWGPQYGLGVQGYTMYSRADAGAGFAWYQGGVHADNQLDAGGGQTLMNLDSAGLNVNGGATLQGNLTFGTSSLRQMLDLNGGQHGIGVQSWTTYFRTIGGAANGGFAWYKGGVHANGQFDPGSGGQKLMSLTADGLVVNGTGNGIQGTTTSGGASAVYGQNDGGGFGVAGRTTGSGTAVYGDNASPTGWAGNFNGRVFVGGEASVCALTIRGGCDLAEPFEMSDREIPKGSLVIIDEENAGKLKLARQEYDTRVAGIVSGANGVNPGISLHQEGVIEGGQNVALSGRVYALADASHGSIKPGDLLTSSNLPGHVMKVTDHAKAQGAIVGKAMSALKDGRGLVLVLVTLQ